MAIPVLFRVGSCVLAAVLILSTANELGTPRVFLHFGNGVVQDIGSSSTNTLSHHIPSSTCALVGLLRLLLGHVACILEQVLPASFVFSSEFFVFPQELVFSDLETLDLFIHFRLLAHEVVPFQLPLSPLLLVLKHH